MAEGPGRTETLYHDGNLWAPKGESRQGLPAFLSAAYTIPLLDQLYLICQVHLSGLSTVLISDQKLDKFPNRQTDSERDHHE